MPDPSYTYRANLIRVIDGDTVVVNVDLGFHCSITATLRLKGIDCAELKAKDPKTRQAAVAARDHWQTYGQHLTVRTYRDDKYGRLLAEVWTPSGMMVNHDLVAEGLAQPWKT